MTYQFLLKITPTTVQVSHTRRLLVALLLTVTTNNNYHERTLIFVTVNIPRACTRSSIGSSILDKFPAYPHANPPTPSAFTRIYTRLDFLKLRSPHTRYTTSRYTKVQAPVPRFTFVSNRPDLYITFISCTHNFPPYDL